jgi:UDPglucose 6-dehydrogenase
MVKLSTNVHLTARVMISNELYLICQKLGIEYDDVKILTQFDRRIGLSHMNVPGPDGSLGFSGSCFPKDIANLSYIASELGDENNVFSAIIKRNEEIRPSKDWQSLKGRAVIAED